MQTNRTAGHGVLRFAQEKSTDHIPASLPSFDDADLRLDWCKVCCWRSRDSPWCHQLLHPHYYVHLLHAVRVRAEYTEVPLVEKVPDHSTDRTVHHNISPQLPNVVHELQLSKAAVILAHDQRRLVHLYVRIILRE